MMDLRTLAYTIMVEAHGDQLDRSDQPYVGHSLRIGVQVMHLGEVYEAVGYLHDVVEDTDWTLDDLLDKGVPLQVFAAVRSLTRREDETYFEYIDRAGKNPIAKAVKIADLWDNMRPGGTESLYKRYRKALQVLGAQNAD